MKRPLLLTRCTLVLLLPLVWSACDRKDPEPAAAAPTASPQAAGNPLVANAANLGMAGKITNDVGLYFGSANLKTHLETLRKTEYWTTLESLKEDKTPTEGAKSAKGNRVEDVDVEEFFVAVGSGSAPAWRWLNDFNRIYGEYTYRTLMTGFMGGGGSMKPENILANAASSPELIERICDLLERTELPPLLLGVKTPKPQEMLHELLPPEGKARPQWLALLKEGTLPLATGGTLTTYEGTVGIWLTDAVRADWMKKLALAVQDAALLAKVEKTLATLAAKPFIFAAGVSDGYVIAAVGNNLNHVKFAATPKDSLISLPDFDVAHAHAGKPVLGLLHVNANVMEALHDDQPLTPMLRSALGGLAGLPIFSALTGQLQSKLDALSAAEKDFHHYTFANASGVFWWDQGLRMEVAGGVAPEGMILDKPLSFSPLMDSPGAVFAMAGHSHASTTGRAYFERWMEFLYTAAGGFIQTGLGGDKALGIYALVDKGVIPPLVKIYDASRTMYREGLGTESALVIDLGGEAAQLPLTPAPSTPGTAAKPMAVPRVASVYEVADRAVLGKAWTSIEANINELLAASPAPMPPMAPINSEKNGLTTWYYPLLAMGGNDLMPCVSISDKIFILGTSKNLHEALAERVAKAPSNPLQGIHYHFSFPALRNFLKKADGTAALTGAAAEKAAVALPGLEPFGNLRGKLAAKNGRLYHSFYLEARDVRRQVD